MLRRQTPIWTTLMLTLAVALAACGPAATTQAPAATSAPATNAPAATAEPGMDGDVTLPEVDPSAFSGSIIVAGSSTVFPLSERMVEVFQADGFAGSITVDSIGSGAGIERFCVAGETDIANASRAIKDDERQQCRSIGREAIEFRVGTDALAVVVSQQNDFLTDVSMEELAQIFSSDAALWSDVNPAWPAETIQRFSPGTDSGTYDYFVEAVLEPVYADDAEAKLLEIPGIQLSEDDNVLVQGVQANPYAIGYFGYAYYQENAGTLKALTIGGVSASDQTVEDGSYAIARPLFMYSDAGIMQAKPQVAAFINYFLTYVNDEIRDVGYFPASAEAVNGARAAWMEAAQ